MIRRELTDTDISEITRIHLLAFSDFFLSQMGESFLKLFYRSLLTHQKGFGIGIFDDEDNLIGFSVATTHSRGFNKNMIINNFIPFSIVGIKLLLTKPKSLFRLFRNMSKNNNSIDDGNYAELFSIAVDPGRQNKGIGKLLLEDVEKIAIEKGCQRITLTTDFINNADVINFYMKHGYAVFYDFIAYPNRKMYKMIKILNLNIMIIPFSPPFIDESVIKEVVDTLKSGWITTGPKVKALEESIAIYTGIPDVLCVNSWTSGAIMILKWLGIKEGDEVIVPAYTYSATALAVLHCGANPVMVDVNEEFVISVEAIRKAITTKTKVIIPVDIAGWPCDYKAIMSLVMESDITEKFIPESEIQHKLNRILVVADAAHSFGAVQNGKSSITMSDIGIFSLHAVKNLTTAEGGAICINLPDSFNNNSVYKILRMMTLNGQTKDAYTKTEAGGWRYDIIMQGLKINMPDICAAIGLAQIRQYNYLLANRKRIYRLYSDLLGYYPWAQLPPQDNEKQTSSYHLYALRVRGISEVQRDLMIDIISKAGIAVNVHFIPMPMLTLFRGLGFKIEDFPVAYDNYSREISLPIYPQLSNSQIEFIVNQIVKSYLSVITNYDKVF